MRRVVACCEAGAERCVEGRCVGAGREAGAWPERDAAGDEAWRAAEFGAPAAVLPPALRPVEPACPPVVPVREIGATTGAAPLTVEPVLAEEAIERGACDAAVPLVVTAWLPVRPVPPVATGA